MTHLDFVSAKEALPRLASTLKPLNKGFSFIIRQECVRPLTYARGDIPHFVVPSSSEASLASLGTASPLTLRSGRRPIHVIPRRVSAEGPLAYARGDKKERLGVTKKREARGDKKREARGDKKREARGTKKERLRVRRREKEKSNNKIKKEEA